MNKLKPYTLEDYEKLPYHHLFHNLTPVLHGCEMDVWWCNDCKILVHSDKKGDYIPYDKSNFEHGYVKRPKIKKEDLVYLK